ncbi:vanin-like protein [Nesidiocoris tenuis]|uniref:Vanin-like protein n=1 Tax=Nesidiocoris tenuis TaxID=355587 RepID=A0ABN7AZI5_9HEMI|nr:vanin-like protein [Nesidiocoris tenuis]
MQICRCPISFKQKDNRKQSASRPKVAIDHQLRTAVVRSVPHCLTRNTEAMSTLCLAFVAICIGTAAAAGDGYYRAAVVEYQPKWAQNVEPRQNLINNVNNTEQYIKKANEQQADIIVFPEGGLMASDDTIFLTVPNPSDKIAVENNTNYDEALRKLSGMANKYQIYLVVNLHENYTDPSTNITLKYNTNVVFDRKGVVVARYRKFNLYGENLNTTKEPEYSIFDTDFNVKFAQIICFDILFKEPGLTMIRKNKIQNIIHSSMWFSELPFLMSVQEQWSWSTGNKVNLLASGYNNIAAGSGGSGIYRGLSGLDPVYRFGDQCGVDLMIVDVPIDDRRKIGNLGVFQSFEFTGQTKLPLLLEPNIETFASEIIPLQLNTSNGQSIGNYQYRNNQLCHTGVCCSFDAEITYDNSANTTAPMMIYRAVVFNGTRNFGVVPAQRGIQICGIISCVDESISSCGKLERNSSFLTNSTFRTVTFNNIRIRGNFSQETQANVLPNVFLWPTAFRNYLLTSESYNWNRYDNGTAELYISKPQQIITAGIHARVFSFGSGNGAMTMSTTFYNVLIPIAVIMFVLYGRRE